MIRAHNSQSKPSVWPVSTNTSCTGSLVSFTETHTIDLLPDDRDNDGFGHNSGEKNESKVSSAKYDMNLCSRSMMQLMLVSCLVVGLTAEDGNGVANGYVICRDHKRCRL